MLSLAKLRGGSGATYWLAQAQGRVTHAQSVSSGVEDYYLAGPEAAGEWMGGGVAGLELGGEVEEVAITRLLDRQHPHTGDALPRPRRGRPPEVDGFDLMFSVPKSASVLFGLVDRRAQGAVVRAQQAAVEEAMRYLDREACLVRVGPQRELERGGGLVGAAFEHRTSRAGDPQVHPHVLVANGTFRGGGEWVALDGTAIYHHARAAGHIHEAAFRRALELGVEWGRAHNGIADLSGFSDEQLRAFSTRAGEIDAYLAEHGWSGAEARQIAALRTRETKDYDVTPEMLLPEWRERARAVGLDDRTLRAMPDREPYRPLDAAAKAEIADGLAGTGGLTGQASSFDRRDVICAFAGAARQGATLQEIEAFADAFLADPRVVAPVPGGRGRLSNRDVLRLDDGRVVPAMTDATRYSTRELLALERAVIDRAVGERAVGVAVAEPAAVQRALSTRPTIGPDQAQMVRRLCSEGHRVHVVVGPPGTGKTFALDAAREAWEASGYVVVGAAVAREAARNLEDKAGIPSTSVASLRMQLDRGGEYGLGPRNVVIVDEAGMLPTRDLHALVEHASAAGAAVVLVGDHHQLPEIDAGGAFRALVMDQAGRLGPQRLVLAGGEFAVGDEVLLRRRSPTAQVNNGTRGRIEAIAPDHEQVTLRLSDDRQVTLDADYLRQPGINGQPGMVYGYAATVHSYQGADTESTFAYGSPGLYRELVYTASSRHRETLRFYLSDPDVDRELAEFHGAHAEPQDAFERFVAQAERSHAQHTPIDRVHRQHAAALSLTELHREADRLERLAARAPGPRLQRELAHAEEHLADTQRTATTAAQRGGQVEAELHGRRRPSRDDRRELAQAQAIERDAHIAVGQAAERVHELRARVQSDRWPVEHAEDLARLAALRDEIGGRAQRHVLRARHIEVPAYLLDELGERPDTPKARGVWDRAAVRIEHYRSSFDVSDPHSALGDRPDELRARAAHDQAQRDVDAAQTRLARDRGIEQAPSERAMATRSHGLGR